MIIIRYRSNNLDYIKPNKFLPYDKVTNSLYNFLYFFLIFTTSNIF
jgi:hypothetical protein